MTSSARSSSTSPCRRPTRSGLTVPDPGARVERGKGGHHDFGEVDWDEFYAVVRGEGPVAKERMKARREAWENGAWVREAAAAYAEKKAAKKAAA